MVTKKQSKCSRLIWLEAFAADMKALYWGGASNLFFWKKCSSETPLCCLENARVEHIWVGYAPWSSWLMARTTGCDFLGRIQVECILYQDCPSAPTPPTSMLHCPGQHGLAGRHWQALDSWTPPLKKSISLLSWSLFNHSDAGRYETNEDVTINSPVRVKIKEFRDNLWNESMNWFIEGGKGD